MTLENFIAELETTFSIYFETGDIDRVSIKTWVIACLREFGKNICEQREAIVEVKNSQATLPETFKSLILALDLTECGYEIKGDKEKIKDSFIYRERIEQAGYYDWITREFITDKKNGKLITEAIVVNNVPVEFYYSPNYLSVVKGFKKDSFDVDCLNLHPSIRNNYKNQISINKNTLQTNFKSGRIYLQYNSLPVDEDGEIIIPEISTSDIVKYIENYVKIRIGENLILNNKNPTGISQLLSMWISQDRAFRLAAKSEANWHGLGKFDENYRHKLQVDFNKYNLPRF
ncbi:MAG TPA: hypothetical protein VLA48_03350 [Nitrososphaeraceae archaeon]|nr:hypothetical protein [Nitrososphaeraceae archaeon]